MPQTIPRRFPGGPGIPLDRRQGQGAFEAHVNRAGPCQQRHAVDPAGGVERPVDRAFLRLQTNGEVDGAGHGGPHGRHKIVIAGHAVVVVEPHGNVRAQVAVAGFVLGPAFPIGRIPAAVRQLIGRQPAESFAGRPETPPDGKSHGRLDVVPGIGFLPRTPGNFTVRPLVGGDQMDQCLDIDG